jgi:hypothetical protein
MGLETNTDLRREHSNGSGKLLMETKKYRSVGWCAEHLAIVNGNLFLSTACVSNTADGPHDTSDQSAVAVAAHPKASRAAMEMLDRGGNPINAAIALARKGYPLTSRTERYEHGSYPQSHAKDVRAGSGEESGVHTIFAVENGFIGGPNPRRDGSVEVRTAENVQ